MPGCARGTLIETPDGPRPVQSVPGARETHPAGAPLLLLPAGGLGEGLPARDLLLAPDQAVLHRDLPVRASALARDGLALSVTTHAPFTLFTPAQNLARAEGATLIALPPESDPLPPRVPGERTGFLDVASPDRLAGWAGGTGAPVTLRIMIDGAPHADLPATAPRADLRQAGLGACGFTLTLDPPLDPALPHLVRAITADGRELMHSPVFLDGQDPHTPLLSQEETPWIRGRLDHVTRTRITGWAWDSRTPDQALVIHIQDGDRPLLRVIANGYRHDLLLAGIGFGRHSFDVTLPQPLEAHRAHLVSARLEDGTELPGSPRALQAASFLDADLQASMSRALAGAEGEAADDALGYLLDETHALRLRLARDHLGVDHRARARLRALREGADAPVPRLALMIDERLPEPGRDAGSEAVLSHARALRALGFDVRLCARDQSAQPSPALAAEGLIACTAPLYAGVEDVMRRAEGGFDLVYLHRASIAATYLAMARHFLPGARIVYSVADLHHLRIERQAKVEDRADLRPLASRHRLEECLAAWSADVAITHSEVEVLRLRSAVPAAAVRRVPWSQPGWGRAPDLGPSSARAGIALLGNFSHAPSEDAACHLIETILPLVRAALPDLPVLIAGRDMGPRVRALAGPGVELVGPVPDLRALWSRVRLSVAPLRFGAGVKGKVLESFAAGLPCAMTPVAAEGLDLPPDLTPLIADTPEALAGLIVRLHQEEDLAKDLGLRARTLIETRYSQDAVTHLMSDALNARRPAVQG